MYIIKCLKKNKVANLTKQVAVFEQYISYLYFQNQLHKISQNQFNSRLLPKHPENIHKHSNSKEINNFNNR